VNHDGNVNWSQLPPDKAWKSGMRPPGGPTGATGGHTAVDSKYKTAMCKFKTNHGFCKNGDSCIFAHSSSELRAKNFGGNGSKMIGGPLNMAKKEIIKTAMCKYQANYGNCKNGDSCIFAHSSSELRAKNFGENGNTMIEGGIPLNLTKNNNKTAMCKYQANYGNCKNGDSCIFAHSSSELRPKNFGGNGNMIMEGGPAKKKRVKNIYIMLSN
jgi:uncharacterized protein YwlG (UPF0340 family)